MSEVKHMNADEKQEESRIQPPRTLFIIDEAPGIDDDKLDISVWVKNIIEITPPRQLFQTFAKPEFPPEAYSIDNLLQLQAQMNAMMLEADTALRKSIKEYIGNDRKRLVDFAHGVHLPIHSLQIILNGTERIDQWFYDRVRIYVNNEKDPIYGLTNWPDRTTKDKPQG